jgi:heptosyltransferase-2
VLFVGRYHLGDFLMFVPALRLARQCLPEAWFGVVLQKKYFSGLALDELVNEALPEIDESLALSKQVRLWRRRFRNGNVDCVVFHRLTRPDLPAVVAAFLEQIPHRVGGAEKGLQALLTDLYVPKGREFVVNYHWNLVRAWLHLLDTDPELVWPRLSDLPQEKPKSRDLLIAPFAQHTKEWPMAHWHALLEEARKRSLSVALSAAPNQAQRATELLAPFPEVENLALKSGSLRDLFAHVQQAHCVIAVDTGIRHVAAALGTPCVVIGHGREHYRIFGAYVPTERYLFHSVPCAPCGAEPCPLGHLQCVRGITVESVLAAWESLMADTPAAK